MSCGDYLTEVSNDDIDLLAMDAFDAIDRMFGEPVLVATLAHIVTMSGAVHQDGTDSQAVVVMMRFMHMDYTWFIVMMMVWSWTSIGVGCRCDNSYDDSGE